MLAQSPASSQALVALRQQQHAEQQRQAHAQQQQARQQAQAQQLVQQRQQQAQVQAQAQAQQAQAQLAQQTQMMQQQQLQQQQQSQQHEEPVLQLQDRGPSPPPNDKQLAPADRVEQQQQLGAPSPLVRRTHVVHALTTVINCMVWSVVWQ